MSNAVNRRDPVENAWSLPTNYYALLGVKSEGPSDLTLTADTVVIMPFYVDRPIGVDTIALSIKTAGAASTKTKVALYEFNPDTQAAGTLRWELATASALDTAATGAKTATVGKTLQPGWYAWAVVSDGAPVINAMTAVDDYTSGRFTFATNTVVSITHYTMVGTGILAGAFPATGTTLTAVTSTSNAKQTFCVFARVTLWPAIG